MAVRNKLITTAGSFLVAARNLLNKNQWSSGVVKHHKPTRSVNVYRLLISLHLESPGLTLNLNKRLRQYFLKRQPLNRGIIFQFRHCL